jgi:hypothetical protein
MAEETRYRATRFQRTVRDRMPRLWTVGAARFFLSFALVETKGLFYTDAAGHGV